jgi:membrane protein DedA with SNARE-associated domain
MSDVPETKKSGGGILKGPDGKFSIRRVTGALLISTGVSFLAWAMTMVLDILKISSWVAVIPFAPGVFLILAGLFCYQMFTAQNITDIVGKAKEK